MQHNSALCESYCTIPSQQRSRCGQYQALSEPCGRSGEAKGLPQPAHRGERCGRRPRLQATPAAEADHGIGLGRICRRHRSTALADARAVAHMLAGLAGLAGLADQKVRSLASSHAPDLARGLARANRSHARAARSGASASALGTGKAMCRPHLLPYALDGSALRDCCGHRLVKPPRNHATRLSRNVRRVPCYSACGSHTH